MPEWVQTDKYAVAAGFSRAAATYNSHAPAQKEFAGELCRFIAAAGLHVEGANNCIFKIADLGCGTGFLTAGLGRLFPEAHIYGFDMAQAMLGKCRDGLSADNFTFDCLDIEDDDFGGEYNLIASSYALQWVDCCSIFKKIYSSLLPGGVFALALPVHGSFTELETAYSDAGINPAPMLHYNAGVQVVNMLSDNGLSVLQQAYSLYRVFYPDAAQALRSFRYCGATFTNHSGHKRLSLRDAKNLLLSYDKSRREDEGRVAITYNTLYVVARREG